MMMRVACLMVLITVSAGLQAQRNKPYAEDLSKYRPKVTLDTTRQDATPTKVPMVPAQLTVNAKVDAVLDSIDKINQLRKFVDGYTIQIYTGQNREEANLAKKTMADNVNDLRADLQFQAPKFRVKVGAYFTRLDAQKDLVRLKRLFPNAILVPEKILIRN
jgi:hypothetical protein